MDAAILKERRTNFVLWRVGKAEPSPTLVIGRLKPGAPLVLTEERQFPLQRSADFPDLWFRPAGACDLAEGEVYHYWFEVTDSHPGRSGQRIRITDPLAHAVDWRLFAPRPAGSGYSDDDTYPPAVIKCQQGRLVPCDGGGESCEVQEEQLLSQLPPNNRLVIYEVPTAWARLGRAGEWEAGVGTFRDLTALVDPDEAGANFTGLEVTGAGRSYLTELGVNAIELCPPADSFYVRQWGYGTTNFFAPDFELGFPADYCWSACNRDLGALIAACHSRGLRVFTDVVMAFSKTNAYLAAATNDFFILDPKSEPDSPDAHNSRGSDENNFRNGFGSDLFRYAAFLHGAYDPVSGQRMTVSPARQLMKAYLLRWMNDFHIDGIRMDSVENIANWDFVQEYKDLAREIWRARFRAQGNNAGADERFLVVGEELTEPLGLLKDDQNGARLDALWHENFKKCIRAALLGENGPEESSFEETVRKAIDCRRFGYSDGAKAIIYLTSHDVEGPRNERLLNFFRNNQIYDAEKRIKLGFACLLTAVGIPMILAGEEFADEHDLFDSSGNVSQGGNKQVDPVNFSRAEHEWRRRVKEYVARLIKFRTTSDALAVNDTEFIHVDCQEGKRVFAWRRGGPAQDPVVVVANFSDFGTENPFHPSAEYRVNNWPATPAGKTWREITQARDVPAEWVGREPLYPWEAKVYALA